MSTADEVRKASNQFYAALSRMANGDAASLGDVWSHDANVTAMHPIGGRHVGWDAVRTSFEQVAGAASDGKIEIQDQIVQVAGDLGYELGMERGRFRFAGHDVTIDHRVTNVYRREAGGWKIIHHHTDISPAMVDIVNRLPKP